MGTSRSTPEEAMGYQKKIYFLLILTIVFSIFVYNGQFDLNRVAPKSNILSNNKRLSTVLNESRRIPLKKGGAPKKPLRKQQELSALTQSEVCNKNLQKLSTHTLDDFVNSLKENKIVLSSDCIQHSIEHESLETKSFFQMFYEKCNSQNLDVLTSGCRDIAFFVKAHIMYEAIKDTPIHSLTDEELIQAFFASMSSSNIKEIVDELLERFPDSPGVAKADIIASLQSIDTFYQNSELSRKVDRARFLNPNDIDVLAVDMFLSVRNSEEGTIQDIEQFNTENSKSGEGYYALAYHSWLQLKRGKSLLFLKEAIKREPSNTKFKETHGKVRTAQLGSRVFGFRVGFRPQSL